MGETINNNNNKISRRKDCKWVSNILLLLLRIVLFVVNFLKQFKVKWIYRITDTALYKNAIFFF